MKLPTLSFIKSTGSKRPLLKQIKSLMPSKFDTYYEPFLGTGILLTAAADKCNKMVGSDISPYLMGCWKILKTDPQKILDHYKSYWPANAEKYYKLRERFNTTYDPLDFFCLTRTSVNGLIRFNTNTNKFNAAFHHCGREGMTPHAIQKLLTQWHQFIMEYNIQLEEKSFEWILDVVTKNDFVFMDPPYKNSGGMYGNIASIEELENMLDKLNNIGCKWMLTFDGKINEHDTSHSFNPKLYKKHEYFKSTESKWSVLSKNGNRQIKESYYTNY